MPTALITRLEARIVALERALGRFEMLFASGRLGSLTPATIADRRAGLEDDLARLYRHRDAALGGGATRVETATAEAAVRDTRAAATWAPADHLVLAQQHVVEGETRCTQQKALIAQLAADRRDTSAAEDLLAGLEQTLTQMREHLRILQAEHDAR